MNTDHATTAEQVPSMVRRFLMHPLPRMILEAGIFFGTLFALKVVLIKPGLGLLDLDESVFRAWQGVLTIAGMFIIYVILMRIYEGRKASELSPAHLVTDGLIGILTGAAMVSTVFAVLWLAGAWHIVSTGSISAIIVPVIWVILMAALEELIFRGMIYRILEEWLGTIVALTLSAILFGGMHIFNDSADLISVLSATSGGLLMGALYSLTGRLWIPIFFHASWNLTQAIFGSAVSGTDIFGTYFESVREGPEWLTGGPFGIENSLITISLIFVSFVFLLLRMQRRNLLLARRDR
jgi:membrane protease YdiL (CAAX protease family)